MPPGACKVTSRACDGAEVAYEAGWGTGKLVLERPDGTNREGLYWRYEKQLRRLESDNARVRETLVRHESTVESLEEDLEAADRIRKRFSKSVGRVFTDAPETLLNGFVQAPVMAVEFEVYEIYLQTPGPGAGSRLVPPAEQST